MSARSLADARNRQLIAQTILSNEKYSSALSANVKADLTKTANSQTSVIQSKLGFEGLGAATIKAQQELADKFGIVTFDINGNISAVPSDGIIDDSINVGTGRFTSEAFAKSVKVLTDSIKPVTEKDTIGSFFNDNIAKPINDFVDFIFDTLEYGNLDEDTKKQIDEIDAEIKRLENKIIALDNAFRADESRLRSRGNELHYAAISLENNKASIRKQIQELEIKKDKILKQFAADNTLTEEIKKLTNEMNALLSSDTITIELKQNAAELVAKGSAVIEKMLSSGVNIQNEIIGDLQRAMLGLVQLQKENITSKAAGLNVDLGFIGEGLFGVATVLTEFFDKLFNPDVETLRDQIEKVYLAQALAIKGAKI